MKKRKMSKTARRILTAFLVFLLLIISTGTAYVVHAYEYTDKFLEGTYINGMDVSNRSPEEVEEAIRTDVEDYDITITFRDGSQEKLSGESIGYRYESDGGVASILANQNRLAWIMSEFGETNTYSVGEGYSFDRDMLINAFCALPEFQEENLAHPTNAYLHLKEDNTFEVVAETMGNAPHPEAALDALCDAVSRSERSFDISEMPDIYETPTVYADNPDLQYQCGFLNEFLNTTVTYTLADNSTETIDRARLLTWITREDNGFYSIDENLVRENCAAIVADMAARTDEQHTSRVFTTTNQGDRYYDCDPYGHVIDQAAETEALTSLILTHTSAEKEPAYSLNRKISKNFGGTYVEVDLDYQRVYLYVDYELIYKTSCVSGTASDPSRHTVRGLFSIKSKEKDRILKGPIGEDGKPSYESHVNYWMPFYRGYGLHDADGWRGEYGGTIYINSGSHGCVNISNAAAQTIYNNVSVGTPVIVFGGY